MLLDVSGLISEDEGMRGSDFVNDKGRNCTWNNQHDMSAFNVLEDVVLVNRLEAETIHFYFS